VKWPWHVLQDELEKRIRVDVAAVHDAVRAVEEALETAQIPDPQSDRLEALEALVIEMGTQQASHQKTITVAVAEGIERVDRSERRIKSTVTRAQKELRKRGFQDATLDAEATDISELNEVRGDQLELPSVHENVGATEQAPSSIPGVPRALMLRFRGMNGDS